jgi:hypothetical protein
VTPNYHLRRDESRRQMNVIPSLGVGTPATGTENGLAG